MAEYAYTFRLKDTLYRKFKYIADYEGFNMKSYLTLLIKNDIGRFEAKYGEITESQLEEFEALSKNNKSE